MSYFDSLSSWQNANTAISNHQAENENANVETKAQTMEQKFANVDKLLGESGGGIGGLGGGVHIGMRMYRKAQKAKQAIEDAKGKVQDGIQKVKDLKGKLNGDKPDGNSNNADDEGAKGANEEPPNTKDGTPDTNEPAKTPQEEPKSAGDDKPQAENEAPDNSPQELDTDPNQENLLSKTDQAKADFKSAQDTAQTDTSGESSLGNQASDASARLSETGSSATEPAGVAEKPQLDTIGEEPEGDFGGGEAGQQGIGESADGGARLGQNPAEGANEELAPKPDTSGFTPTEDGQGMTNNFKSADTGGDSSAVDDIASKVGDAKDAISGVKDTISGVKATGNAVMNTTTDALAQTGEKVGTSVAKVGLESTEGVLDFLGPIGEIIGAGLALGTFFHDLFGKKGLTKKQENAENAPQTISQASGISTASMGTAQEKSNTVGTQV